MWLWVQSSRISIATGSAAVPGVVPDVADVASTDNPELAMRQAVDLAEKFATNVAPAVVPEAAGRARVADMPADLALSCLRFLSSQVGLLALASGQLLQLSLQVCAPASSSRAAPLLPVSHRSGMPDSTYLSRSQAAGQTPGPYYRNTYLDNSMYRAAHDR